LGPIIRYDEEHNTELLRTLFVWVERDQRSKESAHVLGIHGHTLTYRLNRIQLLTGRRFDRLQDIIELWLGLRAYQIVGNGVGNLPTPPSPRRQVAKRR
jgi:purine catabolism regulator